MLTNVTHFYIMWIKMNLLIYIFTVKIFLVDTILGGRLDWLFPRYPVW